jgi:hypothetical protein
MKKKEIVVRAGGIPPENSRSLLPGVASIIERHKSRIFNAANAETILMLWKIGRYINTALFDSKRAKYGKQTVSTLALRLVEKYGATFNLSGLKETR